MKVFDALYGRRSIRAYKTDSIGDEDVKKIVHAAMMAPSAGNSQPWHFVVIQDRALLATIPDLHPNAGMADQAPLAILVCADLNLEKYPGNWMLDCSAATQNLMLAAHGLGIGSVWTGVWPNEGLCAKFRTHFGLPKSIVPLCLVVLGYPDESPEAGTRIRPERIHHDRW